MKTISMITAIVALAVLPVQWLEALAQRMRQLGFVVHVSD
jgi:hypothetical protein